MSLSRELIVAAKARADAATDGPWVMVTQGGIESAHYRGAGEDTNSVAQTRNQEDWEFVTAAREDVPVMADALLRVLNLHTPEERAHDGSGEWSIPLSEWDDDEAPETFTVCSHCGAIEMRESQGESEFASYLEALWPCATVRAVTGEEADRG